MRTALVTGDLGFVGRNIVPRLEAAGYEVQGLDVKRGPHEDARDYFRHAIEQFDLVVHLAAVVGGRVTIDGAPLSVAVDLAIDAEMFQWAVRTEQPRVVYYSSSAAYGTVYQGSTEMGARLREKLLTGDEPFIARPDMSYGWAKLTGEYLAQFARDQGVIVHVLRPFSGYGEDQDLDYPFPAFAQRARLLADPFEVWGDGQQVRDFIHIEDIADATIAVVKADYRAPVNLCTGVGVSFNQLARMFMEEAGYPDGEIRNLPARPVGVRYRVGDPTRMNRIYTPRITLADGIRRALS